MTPQCTKLEPTKTAAETRTRIPGRRNPRRNTIITRNQPTKARAKPQRRRKPSRRIRSLAKQKWIDEKQKEPVSIVEKQDIWQTIALRKRSRPIAFAYLRRQIVKQTMRKTQRIQRNSMARIRLSHSKQLWDSLKKRRSPSKPSNSPYSLMGRKREPWQTQEPSAEPS